MAKQSLVVIMSEAPKALLYHQLFSKLPVEPANTHLYTFFKGIIPIGYGFLQTRACFVM